MKALMRASFISPHHGWELRQRLENLKQGSMGVEETFQSMQLAMIRANVHEDEESTMVRYTRILNPAFAANLELYRFESMTELLHLAIKLENVNKAKRKSHQGSNPTSQAWKGAQGKGSYEQAQGSQVQPLTRLSLTTIQLQQTLLPSRLLLPLQTLKRVHSTLTLRLEILLVLSVKGRVTIWRIVLIIESW